MDSEIGTKKHVSAVPGYVIMYQLTLHTFTSSSLLRPRMMYHLPGSQSASFLSCTLIIFSKALVCHPDFYSNTSILLIEWVGTSCSAYVATHFWIMSGVCAHSSGYSVNSYALRVLVQVLASGNHWMRCNDYNVSVHTHISGHCSLLLYT